MSYQFLSFRDGKAVIAVIVSPRAARNQVVGEYDGFLKIALTAPPVDSRANTALIAFLARIFKKPKNCIVIKSGRSSRRKIVEIDDITKEAVEARLDSLF